MAEERARFRSIGGVILAALVATVTGDYLVIPRRYIFALVVAFGPLSAFWIRGSWNVAMTYMVAKPSNILGNITRCNKTLSITSVQSIPDEYFDWDVNIRNSFIYSFHIAYTFTQIPAGVLADLYGGKRILGFSILLLCFIHFVIPPILRLTRGNPTCFMVVIVLGGFASGALLPSTNALLANWTPATDRGKLGSLVFVAPYVALSVGTVGCNWMIEASESWATVFYVYGASGVLWFFIWNSCFYSKPVEDIRVSVKELRYLNERLKGLITYGKKPMKWRKILTSVPIWALIAITFGHVWIWQITSRIIPIYQVILGFTIKDSYKVAAIMYGVMAITILINGWVVDYIVLHGGNITTVRKVYTVFGSMGPAVFLVASAYSDCDKPITIAFFLIGMGLLSFCVFGNGLNTLDIAPNYSGTIMGITNGFGCIAGVVSLKIKSRLAPDELLIQWANVFWVSSGVLFFTCFFFMIFGSGETQRWNSITNSKSDDIRLRNVPSSPIGEMASETTNSSEP